MRLLDTHSHIYLEDFDNDRQEMLQRAEKEGIIKVVMPAIDSTTHTKMLATESQFENICLSMMGLHPCSVKENYISELNVAKEYLSKKKFYGIGETGLDYYWDLTYKKEQATAFQQQIEWALHYNLPVVIHSRNSLDDCIGMISKNQNRKLKGVFHCFSGSVEQAKQIIDLGFYLGIGGVLTYKNSGLDKVMMNLDLNNVILETDAPYLTPIPFRGKRNEPAYLKYIVQKLSEIKQMPIDEVAETSTRNAQELFSI